MKIIFFDIDGTLICGGSELMSESTKEAIRIARANGHICMINTGRTKRLVGENLTGQVEFEDCYWAAERRLNFMENS